MWPWIGTTNIMKVITLLQVIGTLSFSYVRGYVLSVQYTRPIYCTSHFTYGYKYTRAGCGRILTKRIRYGTNVLQSYPAITESTPTYLCTWLRLASESRYSIYKCEWPEQTVSRTRRFYFGFRIGWTRLRARRVLFCFDAKTRAKTSRWCSLSTEFMVTQWWKNMERPNDQLSCYNDVLFVFLIYVNARLLLNLTFNQINIRTSLYCT